MRSRAHQSYVTAGLRAGVRAGVTVGVMLVGALAGCAGGDGGTGQGRPTPTFPTLPTRSTPPDTTAGAPDSTDSTGGTTSPQPPASTEPPTTTIAPLPPGELSVSLVGVASVEQPVAFAVRPGDAALYVVEQAGRVRAVLEGQLSPFPVLDITDRVDSGGEKGLLGLAFSLDGSTAYVHYTVPSGDGQIDEYAIGPDGLFDEGSRRALLTVRHRDYGNHNGGSVVVGPDGLLYLGFGDGGGGGDPFRAGQDPTTFLGKILRIDPTPSGDEPYTIPADNPFVGLDGVLPEIWSYGLRNPWRFSFDRATGDLWIADVGQGDVEEIDMVSALSGAGAGTNFGWSAYEGSDRYNADQLADNHTPPIHEYSHDEGDASVTGGYVYRGSAIPGMAGAYVFGDYGSGRIWALRPNDEDRPEVAEIANVAGLASFGEDQGGELYVLSIADNMVYRLTPA